MRNIYAYCGCGMIQALGGRFFAADGHVLNEGIDALMNTVPGSMTLEECMQGGAMMIELGAARLCRILQVGIKIGQKCN